MPDTPQAATRRIWWIVALIVFMLALAAVYMMMRHSPAHRPRAVPVNVVSQAP